ncbi:nuclear transport factor 2 family protein [Foetidibacter luteolus]|uniref:nuclear transport factor 2 family protein n=1 Tax=Foetidibacter luteolus TaxID=2608880 RepID=UPI00129BE95B|nr:nuclear transport factor 2 family protein [Foetidibacter luteolus]
MTTTKTNNSIPTTQDVATRFNQLAQQEKWFEIQDELFADNVTSIDPPNAFNLGYAEGKAQVRKKGEDFVKKIEAVHSAHTTEPVVAGTHFAVGRQMDVTVQVLGRLQINEVMLYEVKNGQIVLEQFFY